MNQEIKEELLQRVIQAMREAARLNGQGSPHTDLEVMARAAIEEIMTHGR
jgi:ABC-type phosphate transport system permease subunit